jgi:hypothetical protein
MRFYRPAKERAMSPAVRALSGLAILLLATVVLTASGEVGVYAIVSKVVLEPNDKAPERIQIWGAFTFVDKEITTGRQTLTPQRGYMYYTLSGSASQRDVALKEWADFKTIAGTGQAVAFGRFMYIGRFADSLIAGPKSMMLMGGDPVTFNGSHYENPVRSESVTPVEPNPYPLQMGLTKLPTAGNFAAVVAELQAALKK